MTSKILVFLVIFSLFPALSQGQNSEGDLRVESSAEVQELVAQKTAFNKERNSYSGYKIQIYYGSEKECYEIQEECSQRYRPPSYSALHNGSCRLVPTERDLKPTGAYRVSKKNILRP